MGRELSDSATFK